MTLRTFLSCSCSFLLLGISSALAQSPLAEAKAALAAAPNDSVRIEAMLKISSETCLNVPDTAQHYAQAALALAQKSMPKSLQLAQSHYWCGRTYMTHQQYSEALSAYSSAHDLAAELKEVKLQARCKGNMAIVYGTVGDYARAEQMYYEVAQIFEQLEMKPQMALAYMQIGMIQNDFYKDYAKGIEILNKAADVLAALPDDAFAAALGNAYEQIGYAYSEQNKVDEAIGYFLKALQLYRKANDRIDIVQVNTKLCRAYQAKKDYAHAHTYLDKAQQMAAELDNKYLVMIAHENRGELLIAQRKYKEAVPELFQALDMGKQLNIPLEISETYELLAKAHEGMHKKKQAKEYWTLKSEVDATMSRSDAPKP